MQLARQHCAWVFAVVAQALGQREDSPLYRNAGAAIDERVADLLGRMSLEEKAAQLVQGDIKSYLNMKDGTFNSSGLTWTADKRANSIWTGEYTAMETINKGARLAQDYLVNETPLGIPAFIESEGIHGFLGLNATIFNSPIGFASAWNPALVRRMANVIADEARALGVNQLFAPAVDLARELRFGRVEEMPGEDPYLAGETGFAFVVGLQERNVSAMVKHYAAFGTPEQGINTAPVHGGERELRTTYLPPFKRAIIDGGALSVMSSYNSYDGLPVVAHHQLLTEILKDEWGYEYFVMSDAGGTARLATDFKICAVEPFDHECIVTNTLPAGNDVEMGGGRYSFEMIPDLVRSGNLDQDRVDDAVTRVLRAKFALGLFENPYSGVEDSQFSQHINTEESKKLARDLDAESIVLLENKDGVLPLKKDAKIAVIGPMAHWPMNYGDYVIHTAMERGVTPLDGIRAAASEGKVTYARGCDRASASEADIPGAVSAAAAADVAVVVVGTWSRDQNELWQGLNATTGEHVDVHSLGLVGAMAPLVRAVFGSGTPTVVVFSSGKPIAEPWISESAAALVQQFYPSEQGGNALADVLFGRVNPSGKLSVGFPRHVGTLPTYYDYLGSARANSNPDAGRVGPDGSMVFGHSYVLESPNPLYPLGYGKSYSTFTYSEPQASSTTVTASDKVTISVDITNDSGRDGAEVVQIYIRDVLASVEVPNMQLRGFDKVFLKAKETKTVSIDLDVGNWGLWNRQMKYVVENGEFHVLVGSSSTEIRGKVSVRVE